MTAAPRTSPVLFVGPFPGPTSGQTVMTRFFFDRLVEAAPPDVRIVRLNAARGAGRSRALNMLVKQGRFLTAALGILTRPRAQVCYLSVGANRGMINTLLHAACARVIGARLVLHHHSYSHISTPTALMRALARVAGARATHVCICERMAQELRAAYPGLICNTLGLSNIVSVAPNRATRTEGAMASRRFRLGHMSKLSFEKGLETAVSVLETLRAQGHDVTLHLAGAAGDGAVSAYIAQKQAALGDALIWDGPVYGAAKDRFFAGLDLFVFPTDYKNETQGIVILEALAAGVPVLATARCCIHDDIGPLPGWTVAPGGDYAGAAQALVGKMLEDADIRASLSRMAATRFDQLKAESTAQMTDFIQAVLPDTG